MVLGRVDIFGWLLLFLVGEEVAGDDGAVLFGWEEVGGRLDVEGEHQGAVGGVEEAHSGYFVSVGLVDWGMRTYR